MSTRNVTVTIVARDNASRVFRRMKRSVRRLARRQAHARHQPPSLRVDGHAYHRRQRNRVRRAGR
jgi:hypothetical protein